MNSTTVPFDPRVLRGTSLLETLGIFLLAFATLLYELAFNKVIQVQHYGNLGYVVIGTALFGFALSGVVMVVDPRVRALPSRTLAPACAVLTGLTMLLSYAVTSLVSLDFTTLFVDPVGTAIGLMTWYVSLTLPFFFAGLSIVSLLGRSERGVSWLYGADLVGAGLGAFLSVQVVAFAGGAGAIWVAGVGAVLSGTVLAYGASRRMTLGSAGAAMAAAAFGLLVMPHLDVVVHTTKRGFVEDRDAGKILQTKWSTVSRIDVADRDDHRMLWFDGGSMQSHMFPANSPIVVQPSSGLIPYQLKPRRHALILASSGGKETVWATHHETERVTAVELDPVVVDLVREEYDEYLGGLFNRPEVNLVNSEGRSFVRRSTEKYDVIQLLSAYSVTILVTGAAASMDSYLMTKEAIRDYYERLTDDGVLYISRENGVRLFVTILEALEDMGVDPAGRIYLEDGIGTYNKNAIMLRKTPFPPAELAVIAEHVRSTDRAVYFAPAALYDLLGSDWTPPEHGENTRRVVARIHSLRGAERQAYLRSLPYQATAPTDDKPFYNRTARYLSGMNPNDPTLPAEYRGFAEQAEKYGPIPIGDVPALAVLGVAGGLSGLVIFWPLRRLGTVMGPRGRRWVWPTYFAMLGIGFIAIEVILLQRFILFLGSPSLALAVVLGSLLVYAGIGSALVSPRIARMPRHAPLVFISVCALASVFALYLESVFESWLGLELAARCLLGSALLLPMGLLMGVPFPLGMRLAHRHDDRIAAWGWALNGYATVVGTTATSIVIQFAGYEKVFLFGAACYLIAGLCVVSMLKTTESRLEPELAAG